MEGRREEGRKVRRRWIGREKLNRGCFGLFVRGVVCVKVCGEKFFELQRI